jgi:hypothetical protein
MVAIARGIGLNGHGELILIKKVSTAAYSSPGIAGAKSSRSTNCRRASVSAECQRIRRNKNGARAFSQRANRLSGNWLAAKLAVTRGPAARRGSVRSVSGYLDWIEQPGRVSRSRAKGGQADGCDLQE